MEIAKIQVSGVKAALIGKGPGRWEIPAGIIGGTLRFSYGADWQKLSRTVVFDCGGLTKDVVNAGEIVMIPPEVVARPERKLLVGVYGVDREAESATPTLWLEGYVCAATDPSGDSSTDPTLPVWAQLENRIRALEERNRSCRVIYELDCVTCDMVLDSVAWQSRFTARLQAEEGYTMDTVTVTMGGVDITDQVWQNGTVEIPQVTGDLVIAARAVQIQTVFVAYDAPVTAGYGLNRSGEVVVASENWMYTRYIPAVPGQTFRYTGDSSAFSAYVSVWGYDASGAAVQVLVDNGRYSEGIAFTVPQGIAALRCCWYHGNGEPCILEVLEQHQEMAGEAAFTAGIVITGTGAESGKAGGGATDFIPAQAGDLAVLYNIVPSNGGRIAFYDSSRNFLNAQSIYTQGANGEVMFSASATDVKTAFVRLSTNVMENVRAAVVRGQ